ncbi:glutaredoxin family protein [Lawsonibacter sp.]|uniref:glutaredoxin family protein n=1 Tax=Lawsonibacter sp. TaxID=2185275 RepID=UPI002A7A1AF7|nr:glutaredoxin family protein [Oscillospiraceae bacterium]
MRIYTMPGCSYCHSVKEFLRQSGISYEEVSLAEDKAGQAFMESRGYTGLPVTVIGAEEIMGYNMPRIKAALGLSGANEVK